MKRLLGALALGAGLATIAFLVVAFLEPGRRGLALDIYVLVVGAMAVLTAVFAARQAFPVSRDSTLAGALDADPREPVRPPDLERTGRVLSMASTASFDVHYRLRPILREIAEQRLWDRRGIRLDTDLERAREQLGPELWDVVRADRPEPRRRFGEGIEPERIGAMVEKLEAL
jgi:hypothetical protein